MAIIRLDSTSAIIDSEIRIDLNSDPTPPSEPPQIAASEAEIATIREWLIHLASQIEHFLHGKFRLSMAEAMTLSGIEDLHAAHEWRRNWYRDVTADYCREIHPKVIEAYTYARERGFFDPELEDYYSSRLLTRAEKLPSILRRVAGI